MRRLRSTATALALAILAAPAAATTLSEVQATCPVGGEAYTSIVINSTSQFGMRLDLRPVGPAAYLPWSECPNGFVVFKADDSFTPEEIETLTAAVAQPAYQEARTTHVPGYRVYLLYRALEVGEDVLAFALLKAAWEAEDDGKAELRATYLREALAGFERWGGTLSEGGDDWWTAALVSAEIRRQLGDFAGATAAIDALPTADRPADDMIRLAADQIRGLAGRQHAEPAAFAPPEESPQP